MMQCVTKEPPLASYGTQRCDNHEGTTMGLDALANAHSQQLYYNTMTKDYQGQRKNERLGVNGRAMMQKPLQKPEIYLRGTCHINNFKLSSEDMTDGQLQRSITNTRKCRLVHEHISSVEDDQM